MNSANLLALLLPPVSYDDKGPRISAELAAEGAQLDAVKAKSIEILSAVTPFNAGNLLADWERVYGLVIHAEATYQERLSRVLAKMAETGGLSIPYFINLAAAMGYDITIDELQPFRVSANRCGDTLYTEDIIWVWRVNILNSEIPTYHFRTGASGAGERLLAFGDSQLETVFNDLKPAETLCIFAYQKPPDLSPIDLTTPELDLRVRYLCASPHAEWGEDGLLHYAPPNIWPLAYKNGIAVGRHEPERQSTNYFPRTTTPETAPSSSSGAGSAFSSSRKTIAGIPTATYRFTTASNLTTAYSLVGGTNFLSGGGKIAYSVFVSTEQENKSIVLYADITDYTPIPISSMPKRLMIKHDRPVGQPRFCWLGLRGIADVLIADVNGFQVEAGDICSSPILTGSSSATREQADVFVQAIGAKGIRLIFTNGDVEEHPHNGAFEFQLPLSTRDWGTRYCKRIEFITN
ncbi:YmfQ family protein [Limnobaculum xujianqingii]|uniref:YmfQ family protein n=1 Tax=Limnobaculum xujianqingii TaxID=2738837 RepID=UPI0011298322|nr:putative phage tail protein [Limnobaculum xujianqingii]